jgi:glycerol-3-phosphate dehydrogenase (NAD(P)+)
MAKIFIIGAGSFGTALAQVFSGKNEVCLYSIEKDVVDDINDNHRNSKYLKEAILNKSINSTLSLEESKQFDILVLAVPSQVAYVVLNNLKKCYNNQPIISISKGLFKDGKVITDLIYDILRCNKSKIMALSGPNIATELAQGHPAAAMLAGNRATTRRIKKFLESPTFYIKITTDIKGIQLLGLYKNILAILVGICNSFDMGKNFRAALLSKAYSEFYYLNIGKNITRHSFIDFAGLGDLFVTATAPDSRNIRFGYLLGQGKKIDEIKKEIGQVVEGYENLLILKQLKDKSYIDENLLNLLYETVNNGSTKEQLKLKLMKYLASNNIKNIIFDWGCVLTPGVYSENVAKIIVEKYNYEVKKVFNALVDNEKGILLGIESFSEYFKKVKKELPELDYSFMISSFKKAIQWDYKVVEYCRELKGNYKLFLLSNNYSIVADILKKSEVNGVNLSKIFDGMVFSNEIKLIKPGFKIYKYLIDKYKLRPENCMFIDDTAKNTKAAEQNKLNAITFNNLDQLKKEFKERFIF